MRSLALVLLLPIVAAVLTGPAHAQSLQRFSVQGSGAVVFPTSDATDFENATRLGWEGQLRYTVSRFSLGAGYQRSTVYKLQAADFTGAVSVVFLEPRFVAAASARVALYLAGRAGVGTLVCSPKQDCAEQSMEPAVGGGGGLLFALGERVSLDLGSQYFSTRFTPSAAADKVWTGYLLARLGLSIGL